MSDLIRKFFSNIPTEKDYSEGNFFYPPATDEKILEVQDYFSIKLPQGYIDFLRTTNGYDGKVGESHVTLLQIEQVIQYTNDYGETYPWIIFIGTDGGNEMYIVDKRNEPLQFGLLPYIGSESDFISLGTTFESFVEHLYKNDFWGKLSSGEEE